MSSSAIPRIVHRIWLGGPEPASERGWARSWERHHPDWEVVTWTDQTLPALDNQRWFDAASGYAQKADIARYELLARFGGVYVDTDFEALRPLDPLLDGVTCFCASEDDVWCNVAIIGGVPGHRLFTEVVAALPESMAAHPEGPVNVQTGPWFFTPIVNRLRSSPDPVAITVFGPELFYPYHFSEPERAGGPFPDAYAVHHWQASWTTA